MTPSVRTVQIVIVDDSELVRRGVAGTLAGRHGDIEIVIAGEAGTVASAITEVERLRPDVVLLDIRLPDGVGFTACREILRTLPATRILVLTSYSSDEYVYEAIVSGAHGYLMKEIDPAQLIDSIQRVVAGESILGAGLTERVLRLVRSAGTQSSSQGLGSLSGQERRVLALVAKGRTNKEIAEELGLSDNTVKNYLVSVFEKLQVKRRSQAAALYVQMTGQTAG